MTTAAKMPALFVGHGNPMNAIEENGYTQAWSKLGASIPRPKAVLAVSAHWYISGLSVTSMGQPRTIHELRGVSAPAVSSPVPAFHYRIGARLAPLRAEGVLLMGSGNIVHNLHAYAWGRHSVEPFDWAVRFEETARRLMITGDHRPLIEYESLGRDALLSAPTPDHYLPLLYVLGAQTPEERMWFPVEGVECGSVSMLAVQIG